MSDPISRQDVDHVVGALVKLGFSEVHMTLATDDFKRLFPKMEEIKLEIVTIVPSDARRLGEMSFRGKS